MAREAMNPASPSNTPPPAPRFRDGFVAVAPLVPGVAVFALVYGVVARQVGLSLLATTMMSALVFAGAAQFTAVSMWGLASGALIVVTTLMINLRHLLMGALMAPHLRGQSATWKALLAFGLVDESYALAISRYLRGEGSREFFLGVNVALYVAWVLSGLTGGVLGGLVMQPARWGIDLVFPLAFLGLLVPLLTRPVTGAVAAASGLVAVVAAPWLPGKGNLVLAILLGSGVGTALEAWWTPTR
jgi:4-azaleucine resistance transporter AzlC